jgi:hypothetical protein
MIKLMISSIIALTFPVILLILWVVKFGKPLKSCGESCECFDENKRIKDECLGLA